MNTKLKPDTVLEIVKLIENITDLLKSESNIEVIWKLQEMQNNNLLSDTARSITDSLSNSNN